MSSSSSSHNQRIKNARESFLTSMLYNKRGMESSRSSSSNGTKSKSNKKKDFYEFHDIFSLKDLKKYQGVKNGVVELVYQHQTDKEVKWKEVNIYLLQYLPAVAILGSNFLVISGVKWETDKEMEERYEKYSSYEAVAEPEKRLFVKFVGVEETYQKIGGITDDEIASMKHWFPVPSFWVDALAPLADEPIKPILGDSSKSYVIFVYDIVSSESARLDSYGKKSFYFYGKSLLCHDSLRALIPSVRNEAMSYYDKSFLNQCFSEKGVAAFTKAPNATSTTTSTAVGVVGGRYKRKPPTPREEVNTPYQAPVMKRSRVVVSTPLQLKDDDEDPEGDEKGDEEEEGEMLLSSSQ